MIQGVKKFSELLPLTPNGTERLPAIQDVGGGVFVNGYIDLSSVSNLYNSDGTLTSNRTVSLDGNSLSIKDEVDPTDKCEIEINYNYARIWKLLAGIASGFQASNSLAELSSSDSNVIPSASFFRVSPSGALMHSEAPLTSNPLVQSTREISVESEKIRLIGVGANNEVRFFDETEPSAAMNMMPTDKGILIPRLTRVQRDAISSPANYLTIVNTDTHRVEMYHPTFGWVGTSEKSVMVQANTLSTLSVGTVFYFGNMPVTPSSANREFKSPFNGKITGASIRCHAVSVAGDRTINLYIRINNTTDYLIQTVSSSSANREFINFALNTTGIPITTSDTIVIKAVASGGTTSSTNVLFGGTIIIQ